MIIGLAQINPTIGDIAGNTGLILGAIERCRERGVELVVFPEMAVLGYPPKDLLLKAGLVDQCVEAAGRIAAQCVGITAIVGYPCPSDAAVGRSLYNAAAVCAEGRIVHRHVKSLLPTYDVFDESRYFEPGPATDLTVVDGARLGISICEDLWNDAEMVSRQLYHDNPIEKLAGLGAELFINCSASPFVARKHEFRLKLLGHTAKRYGLPMVYVNQVGGNDELVFDGNSCVFDGRGQLIAHAKDFEPDLLIVDIPPGSPAPGRALGSPQDSAAGTPAPGIAPGGTPGSLLVPSPHRGEVNRIETPKRGLEAVYHALVLGLRDYCAKCGFKSIVLGLSGGIDSAVTGCLAVAAVGPENVRGVGMPSRYSSAGSVEDARRLAENLTIRFDVVPIGAAHEAFERMLGPLFEGRTPDTTEENIQARVRGVVLMAMSNKFGSLLVSTGNKSELAVGYCTLYGDMAGGMAVISDVPKMMVWDLARWINESPASPLRGRFGGAVIPENSITKPPSAELRPNQTDQDSLPPYEVLDQIIERYVEREQTAVQIIEAMPGVDRATILRTVRLIDLNEYKRKQAAPGLKITGRAFGFGRRMPMAQRYDPEAGVGVECRKSL